MRLIERSKTQKVPIREKIDLMKVAKVLIGHLKHKLDTRKVLWNHN